MKVVKRTLALAVVKPPPAAREVKELPTRAPGGRVYRSWAFYGRSGSGKTTLAGTFPGPILLLDVKDVGDDSLDGHPDLKVMDITSWEDFEIAYWWLVKNPGRFKTVVIDTMTQLQQLAVKKVLEDKGKSAEKAGQWGSMTKQDWGAVAGLMKSWIIFLRDLPMQVVFIAQDRVFNVGDEDATEGLDPEVGPSLSPSIAKTLNAAVHFLANTFIRRRTVVVKVKNPPKGTPPRKEVDRIEFCVRVGPSPVYITKVRKPRRIALPPVVVDPTYDKLLQVIVGTTTPERTTTK